jgi:hypothetical protein
MKPGRIPRVQKDMERRSRPRRLRLSRLPGLGLAAGLCLGGLGVAGPSAADPALLYGDAEAAAARFGLAGSQVEDGPAAVGEAPARDAEGRPVSPFLAGLLSAVVPGSGQLAQGQRRGWVYLGIEAAIWFSYFALHDAGNQSQTDYQEFAGDHWDFDRYAGPDGNSPATGCGQGLGPTEDFPKEKADLLDLRDNDEDGYYEEIGINTVYACGWDAQANRADFLGMRDHANGLFGAANTVASVAVLNHLVSAVDAARSAARRRKAPSLGWRVSPSGTGVAVQMALSRTF